MQTASHTRTSAGRARSAFLAGPRGLPYFSPMKAIPILLCCVTLLWSGCAIEEVDEHHETGTLSFRAENLADAHEAVSGTLDIAGHNPPSIPYSGTDSLLVVTGLPLDSALTLSFTPTDPDLWFDAAPLHLSLSSAAPRQTHVLRLTARTDSTLSVVVRTLSDGFELTGMPLWLDGVRWPQESPATVHFSAGTTHLLESRNETCTRGSQTFSYLDAPTEDLVLDLPAVQTSADANAPDADLVVNGQSMGSYWDRLNAPAEAFFVSAWRPGFRPDPAFFSLDGFCGEDAGFEWIANPEGNDVDQLFQDFTLEQVLPGQSIPLGQFSLRQTRGRVVLITFWFIDCPACMAEMPGFQDLLDEYGDEGFRVLALNPFPSDQATQYPDYDFTFLRDVGNPSVTGWAEIGGSFPTNFILRPDGRIYSIHGGLNREALEEILIELLP